MSGPRKVRTKETASLPEFEVVLPMTRRAQIAGSLRNLILSGQLTPGMQLVESKLASRFAVSRGSIREAIRELVDEGLLINRPYAGTFVVNLDEKMLIELFSLRGALEQFCFTQLWPRRNDIFRKEFIARHLALVKAVRAGKRVEAIKAEMYFHSYPYEFCGNQILLEVWYQLSQKIQLSFVMSQAIVHDNDFIGTSERFVELALGRDLSKMLREIERHLELGLIAAKKLVAGAAPFHPSAV
jgi:DNA-binding GntR family transcriptional regulator